MRLVNLLVLEGDLTADGGTNKDAGILTIGSPNNPIQQDKTITIVFKDIPINPLQHYGSVAHTPLNVGVSNPLMGP